MRRTRHTPKTFALLLATVVRFGPIALLIYLSTKKIFYCDKLFFPISIHKMHVTWKVKEGVVASKSRTTETYEALRQNLLDGAYAPGKKLKIDQISKDLHVSPGAVREALSRLTSDGLVVSEPQRGFLAAPISVEDLTDLTSVRVEIEINCLRRSIRRGDLQWEGAIKSIWHQLEHTSTHSETNPAVFNPRWSELHAAFHDSLISACDSPWRLKLREQMFTQAERYRRMLMPFTKVRRDPHDEHKCLVEAVLARNADLACDLLSEHLNKTADILLSSDAPFSDVPRKQATHTVRSDASEES